MLKLLRAVGVGMLVAILVTACSSRTEEPEDVVYHPDYPHYSTAADLFARATLVVEGRIMADARSVKMFPAAPLDPTDPKQNPNAGAPTDAAIPSEDPTIVTIHTVQVLKVLKGNVRVGQSIEVKELGGVVDGVTYREAEATPLRPGKPYVLFLETYPDAAASLLNSSQGKYEIDSAGSLVAMPGNAIRLTRTELGSLAARK